MLLTAHILVFLGAAAGILYLLVPKRIIFSICQVICGIALLGQLAFMLWFGFVKSSCPLLDAWGVMAMVTIAGIIFFWQASRTYESARILIGGMVLISLVLGLGRAFFSFARTPAIKLSWPLSFHIILATLGLAMLFVGCVAGVLIVVRSRSLKSAVSDPHSEVPWTSLTSLDRLFVRSVGWGIVLLAAGMILGVTFIPGASLAGAWYLDSKVLLTTLGCALYMVVWLQRRRRGFCSRSIVGLATLGYAFILVGFFASGMLAFGFHSF